MELLDQPAYSGPPPRYSPGATVYYHGLAYTVLTVTRGIGAWLYELDRPGEVIGAAEWAIFSQADVDAVNAFVEQTTTAFREMVATLAAALTPVFEQLQEACTRLAEDPILRALAAQMDTRPAYQARAARYAHKPRTRRRNKPPAR